jgi:hypothetical protein
MGSDCIINKHCAPQEWSVHGNAVLLISVPFLWFLAVMLMIRG